jgi:hypothetical protein
MALINIASVKNIKVCSRHNLSYNLLRKYENPEMNCLQLWYKKKYNVTRYD